MNLKCSLLVYILKYYIINVEDFSLNNFAVYFSTSIDIIDIRLYVMNIWCNVTLAQLLYYASLSHCTSSSNMK